MRVRGLVPAVSTAVIFMGACVACSATHNRPSASSAPSRPSAPSTPATPAPTTSSTSGSTAVRLPRPAHVVIVVEENHSYSELLDPRAAPFLASLAARGSVLTQSYAVAHPSQPNYLALFSGSTQGVTDDSCPQSFSTGNLGSSLIAAGQTFAGYSEDQPGPGYRGCSSGSYARKHNPWSDFTTLASTANQPLTALPTDFARLPTVAFVVPNEVNDMHSGTVADGDLWLKRHLQAYVAWAPSHDSVLVVTADEDDHSSGNQVLTLVYGAHVRVGTSAERIDHYSLLRTVEDMYGLVRLGRTASAAPITGIWTA